MMEGNRNLQNRLSCKIFIIYLSSVRVFLKYTIVMLSYIILEEKTSTKVKTQTL